MEVIVTYGIKKDHTEIKAELKSLGFKDTIASVTDGTNNPAVQQFSDTTLLKYGVVSITSVMDQVVG